MQSRTVSASMQRTVAVCRVAPPHALLAHHGAPLLASVSTARSLGSQTRLSPCGTRELVKCACHAGSAAGSMSITHADMLASIPFQQLTWNCKLDSIPLDIAAALQLDETASDPYDVLITLEAAPEHGNCLDAMEIDVRRQLLRSFYYRKTSNSGQWRLQITNTGRKTVPTWLKNHGLQWTQRYKASPAQPGSTGPCQLVLEVQPAPGLRSSTANSDDASTVSSMVDQQTGLQWRVAQYPGNGVTLPAVESLVRCNKALRDALRLPATVGDGALPRRVKVSYRAAPGSEAAMEAKGLKVPESYRLHSLEQKGERWVIKPPAVHCKSGPTKGMVWDHWFAVEQPQAMDQRLRVWLAFKYLVQKAV
ncbi:hypothetical protein QJQ45_022239 [Haematococcus lacustris]|nr:hypothetical protein QJQ45_022239 [Haematococcus lacustris]